MRSQNTNGPGQMAGLQSAENPSGVAFEGRVPSPKWPEAGVGTAGRRGRAGFTMIELLVVIAITVILIGLLFGPLIEGFATTSRAQTEALAQDIERLAMNQITRELTSAAALRDNNSGLMDLVVMQKLGTVDGSGNLDSVPRAGTQVVVHVPHGYADIVPAQHLFQNANTIPASVVAVADPTSGRTLVLQTRSSGAAGTMLIPVEPDLVTPIAPDNSIIRYFIGLRYPFNISTTTATSTGVTPEPYQNIYDNEWESSSDPVYGASDIVTGQINNTYVFYRASVQPFTVQSGSSTPSVNTKYFDFTTDSQGNQVPVLDDPDFFRIVQASDPLPSINPHYDTASGATDNTYGQGGTAHTSLVDAHNTRVYWWYKTAVNVAGPRDTDCIGFLRPGNQLQWAPLYESGGAPSASGSPLAPDGEAAPGAGQAYCLPETIIASGLQPPLQFDTVTENGATTYVPIVPPTISISLGGSASEAPLPQQVEDISQGAPETGYVPAVFRTKAGQIAGYPTININGGAFTTRQATVADINAYQTSSATPIALSDMVETTGGAPVYDISQGLPIETTAGVVASSFVPFAYNPIQGTLNFAAQSVPAPTVGSAANGADADPHNPLNPYWYVPLSTVVPSVATANVTFLLSSTGLFPGNPLGTVTPPAQIVVNSERVLGPNETPGPATDVPGLADNASATEPAQFNLIPYTRVENEAQVGPNQYYINYSTGEIDLAPENLWGSDLTSSDPQRNALLVSYKYQNNFYFSGGTPTALPVTVSYSSSNLVTINMGVRVYDSSSKIAAFFSQTNTVTIGNGTR